VPILIRDSAMEVLNLVTVAPITSAIRSIPTEVVLTEEDDLPTRSRRIAIVCRPCRR